MQANTAHTELSSIDSTTDQGQAAPTYPARRYFRARCPEDDAAIAAIRARYGLHTDNDAILLALRLVAGDAIKVAPVPATTKKIIVRFKARPVG